MRIAYFDCFSGVSGDMILGALVDAGLDMERLRAELARLPVSDYTLSAETVQRRGLRGTHVEVTISEVGVERHLHQIEEIIAGSDLPDTVKQLSLAIFQRLAKAEAHVHGIPMDHVHFHEVGAVDAIVDVVGAAVGLWLMGVERVYASPVHVGCGTVTCAHGTLPVPAPATQELLRGVPIYGRDVEAELVTPTGAAILTTLVEEFGTTPPMQVAQVGYGAGTRDLPLPNLLRVSIGETADQNPADQNPADQNLMTNVKGYEEDVVTVVETNIDDMNPEFYEHVMARLFDAGALDVFLTPIQMKEGRPAVQLTALVTEGCMADTLDVLFAETTTIGVRTCPMYRWKLGRERLVVDTCLGPVGVKVARRGDTVLNVAPEYQECRRIATEQGVPLKEVYQVALEAARVHVRQE
jgi:uncharacterized protein (TIGR00299 family) protein